MVVNHNACCLIKRVALETFAGKPAPTEPATAMPWRPRDLGLQLHPAILAAAAQGGTEANPARIINIGSVAGISSFGEQAFAYGLSKAALHQLSRILARELVSQHINVNVNVIAPGGVFPSKMTQHIGNDEQALAQDTALIPMKRWGREEEMAALAISLASTAGAYMTGNIIPLDGGFSL